MKSTLLYSRLLSAAVIGAALVASSGAAFAQAAEDVAAEGPQEGGPAPDQSLADKGDIIIITGTRGEGRSVTDSPVPVDVLTAGAIEDVSFTDTADVLKTLVPSYTIARQPISDGATFVRPAALRGLSSDKTLVLVNSKRRHRAALVSIGGSGTQGPDVSTIPASALKTIEVLRDGAAAQYGSDAIAGVINFILKDAPEGGEIQFQTGQYFEEDGEDLLVAGNLGLPIGENGFVNISVEGTTAQPTNRGQQWSTPQSAFDVASYVAANPSIAFLFGSGARFDSSNVQIWGQPESEAFRLFVNSGYKLSDAMELYAFANYSNSDANGDFNYRHPNAAINQAQIRLPNGSLFRYLDQYPAGRTPRFYGNVIDYSATGGIKGDFTEAFSYDFSARYGKNKIVYTLDNTLNASLGPLSPTLMHPGDLVSDEVAANMDFTYEVDTGFLASPLNIGFGAEYRDEGYETVQGEAASYVAGPYAFADPYDFCTNEALVTARTPTAAGAAVIANGSTLNCGQATDPVYTVHPGGVGSDGFPGYSPDYSGSLNRDSQGVYVDFEADVLSNLFVNVAARYETFSDFGETTDYKIAGRWSVTDFLNIRGSVGTGFRAPTPGQLSTTNVSTRFPAGEPVASGLFPADNPVSLFLGAQPLKPETSTNYSLGATGTLGGFDVTLDFYKIELEDQFYATRSITVTPAIRTALLAANVPGADTIGAVQFFQNAFNSTTEGVDLVVSYDADWGSAGETNFTFSANYNTFEVGTIKIPGLFLEEDVFDFEEGTPLIRATLTATHTVGPFTFMGRANHYGEYTASNCLSATAADGFTCGGAGLVKQTLAAETLYDIEVAYDITDATSVALGVRNVFDEYPDEGLAALAETSNGRIYRSDSIVDWMGGFVYLRAKHSF